MPIAAVSKLTLLATLLGTAGAAQAASLDAWAGVIGGGGSASIAQGCTTFGSPVALSSYFTFNGFVVPQGGIGACGYSGNLAHAGGAVGPLSQGNSLAPVILGNPGYSGSFDGSANAVANYRQLGATAHANISGGTPGSPTALFESVGAARFADTLTASSALVANGSAGWVRYQFSVTGQSTSLGAPGAYLFGDTYVVLDVQQQSGPVYEVLNAHVGRGTFGTISNGAPPAGWNTSMGSLGGGSTFYSVDLPMTWGQSWDVKVGLLAWAYGTADASFAIGANLTGVSLFGADHKAITQFSLTSGSGTDYVNAVPEPQVWAMLLAGLALLEWCSRRRQR